MKKNFLAGYMGILIFLVMATAAQAQLAFTKTPSPKDLVIYARMLTKDESFSTYRNNISTRAVRDFMEKFENVSGESWYNAEDRFVVMFKLDDVNYRLDYDQQGRCIQTIRSYGASKSAPDIIDMIRSSYPHYNIFLVQEVEMPLHPINYFIHLEGKKRLINLRVYNGDIEELENFRKSE